MAPGCPRVGVIVPRGNTACERELGQLGGAGYTVHTTRMRFVAGADPADPEAFYLEALREPAIDLGLCGASIAALGCMTAAMSCSQPLLHRALADAGGQAVLVSEAIIESLREAGARRVALFSPYTKTSNDGIVAFLGQYGFETVSAMGLGLNVSAERFRPVSRFAPEFIRSMVGRMNLAGADCLFLSCTDMPTLDAIPLLERDLGIPVISTNLALYRGIERALAGAFEGAAVPVP